MTIPLIRELKEIAGAYDGFVLDLWGVIHDGSNPYPGVAQSLASLQEAQKKVVLLSNSPRRAASLVLMMEQMGIGSALYNGVMSSGEAVHAELLSRRDPWFASLGQRCYHVGPTRDLHLFDGLNLERVALLEDAEFLLNTGPDEAFETLALYQPMLDRAQILGLPMICANPDLVVIHEGQELLCAGALAAYYEQIGGDVRYRGKPDPSIYKICLQMLGVTDHRRILAIGDAFHTDMQGAARAGLDAVLCSGGIHAAELGTIYGQPPHAAKLRSLAARYPECHPIGVIPGLIWSAD